MIRPSLSALEMYAFHASVDSTRSSVNSHVLSSRKSGGRCTMYSAPTAACVSAIARKVFSVSAQASGLCRMPQPVPATTRKPRWSISSCSRFGSLGK